MKKYVDILSKNSGFYDKNAVFWQTSSDFCFLYREEISSNFLGKSHLFFCTEFFNVKYVIVLLYSNCQCGGGGGGGSRG